MTHTFLLEQGIWDAKGTFTGADGHERAVEGRTVIIHNSVSWLNESRMKLTGGDAMQEYQNNYEIEPLKPGAEELEWKSFNPALGALKGRFMLVDDSIISHFRSDSGQYSGIEFMVQESPDRYKNRGVLYRGGKRLSAWSVELVRRETGMY